MFDSWEYIDFKRIMVSGLKSIDKKIELKLIIKTSFSFVLEMVINITREISSGLRKRYEGKQYGR